MPDQVHTPVWSEADDRRAEGSYAAVLTRRLGVALHGGIVLGMLPIPFVGVFLLAGIVVTFVALPIRVLWWHHRFGTIEPENPEMIRARRDCTVALLLWLASPVTLIVASAIARALVTAIPHR